MGVNSTSLCCAAARLRDRFPPTTSFARCVRLKKMFDVNDRRFSRSIANDGSTFRSKRFPIAEFLIKTDFHVAACCKGPFIGPMKHARDYTARCIHRNKASLHNRSPPFESHLSLFVSCFLFLRAGDAGGGGGGSVPSTKEITAGCGTTYSIDGNGTAIQGGSQRPEQHEKGGDPQADRRERKTQGQSSAVLGQSAG